ncbi:MAG TPA: hypothetical protein VFH77_17395 [Streptomyces sp.]|nr:hypothetical protein [Streptomyces sp.]
MICQRCMDAAAQRLGREHHCAATGGPDSACHCQHRTDRYGTAFRTARPDEAPVTVVIHVHPDPTALLAELRRVRRNGSSGIV